jgi:hypothetical protein
MKRTSTFLFGIFLLVMLSVGMIGAGERLPPEGPLALLYDQIHALFVEAGLLAAESDDQQEQIDQLTATVCGLSVATGNPASPELCEVVVTEICEFDESVECVCYPGDHFELVSCEPGCFPHPDFGEDPPPKCDTVNGCRGTFTRTEAGDVGTIEVDPNCKPGGDGVSGGKPCPDGCLCGSNGVIILGSC